MHNIYYIHAFYIGDMHEMYVYSRYCVFGWY